MATYTKFNCFIADCAQKKHNIAVGGDQLKLALTNVAPVAGNTVLANITEISYTNLSARALTISAAGQTGGVFKCVVDDLTLNATGDVGPFRYIVVYNDTATNDELVSFFDKGESITLHNGESMLADFDQTNGLFQNS